MAGTGEQVLFWVLGPLAVIGALGLVFAKKAVHAALGMALTMIILGVFYIAQGADFLGIIQIFVYTGAVIMLFLFVVMLIGIDSSDSLVETIGQRWVTALLCLGLGGILVSAIAVTLRRPRRRRRDQRADGNVTGMRKPIFGRYVWVFEMTSALLITAALGAMALAHRERLGKGPNQREWSRRRFQSGETSRACRPRVYARLQRRRHPGAAPTAVPRLSVSRVLAAREQNLSPEVYLEAESQIERDMTEESER